ncbi:DUF421 domain-containing protein [Lysinibacillus sp. SGAir0095]|uniref:DUF421 domain-containing protein n=1 Tax=Lysinibacillus sp. SGAir0095 TaxID=2070463 RepID=UPI0010CCE31A|nr:DUF421 domain-containing protein [Lysinibacillus sp. SGAir0095]QCR34154.1 DUF421 domain-containing protein [Lysinibacillus sp. SGAir0095]
MDFHWIWKAILIVIGGTLILRIAGRKSISQMTLAQTVIMIGLGSLLIQPVAGEDVWTTLLVGITLVLTLVVVEYIQLKSDKVEKFITGKSKILIENGSLHEQNLRKLRITVDQLEMSLRQQSVKDIKDIQYATLEPNGRIGYILKEEAQPASKKDIQLVQQEIHQLALLMNSNLANQIQFSEQSKNDQQPNLFTEVENKPHKSNQPKHLQ